LPKMIVVNFNFESSSAKNFRHLVPTKLTVEKESQLFKRLRRG
jgi:hypothetical protein